jgi:hypothetical protein
MSVLTNKERMATRSRILEATFAPLVSAFMLKVKAALVADHAAKHPSFVEAANMPNLAGYLTKQTSHSPHYAYEHERTSTSGSTTLVDKTSMYWPSYNQYTKILESGAIVPVDSSAYGRNSLSVSDIVVYSMYSFQLTDELKAEYLALVVKRQTAFNELTTLLYSYRARAMFETDFPELAKYLPEKVVQTRCTAVAIPVASIKATLLGLGIPTEEKP